MSVELAGGTTVSVKTAHENRVIVLDNPEAPNEYRNAEIGRIVEHRGRQGLQPAPFSAFALSPEVLRAIAQILENPTPKPFAVQYNRDKNRIEDVNP